MADRIRLSPLLNELARLSGGFALWCDAVKGASQNQHTLYVRVAREMVACAARTSFSKLQVIQSGQGQTVTRVRRGGGPVLVAEVRPEIRYVALSPDDIKLLQLNGTISARSFDGALASHRTPVMEGIDRRIKTRLERSRAWRPIYLRPKSTPDLHGSVLQEDSNYSTPVDLKDVFVVRSGLRSRHRIPAIADPVLTRGAAAAQIRGQQRNQKITNVAIDPHHLEHRAQGVYTLYCVARKFGTDDARKREPAKLWRANAIRALRQRGPKKLFNITTSTLAVRFIDPWHKRNRGLQDGERRDFNEALLKSEAVRAFKRDRFVSDALALILYATDQLYGRPDGVPEDQAMANKLTSDQEPTQKRLRDILTRCGFHGEDELRTAIDIIVWAGPSNQIKYRSHQ